MAIEFLESTLVFSGVRKDEDGSPTNVSARFSIAKPVPFKGAYSAHLSLGADDGFSIEKGIIGADAIQALRLALELAERFVVDFDLK